MRRYFVRACVTIACLAASRALPAPADNPGQSKLYVTGAASTLKDQGLAEAAPAGPEAAGFERVPGPAVRMRNNEAQATTSPWIALTSLNRSAAGRG